MRILFLAPYLPSLIRVRPFNLIRALAERGHQITLLALYPPGDDASGLPKLRDWCQSVQLVRLPRWRPLWNGLQALPTSVPFQAAYSRSPQMAQLIQRTLSEDPYDIVHLEHLRGAELGHTLNSVPGRQGGGSPPVVFDAVDSISLLFEHARQSAPRWQSRLLAWLDLGRTRRYEAQFTRRFARVLVTSPQDRDALVSLTQTAHPPLPTEAADRLTVLPNGVDLGYFKPLSEPREPDTVIFSGKMSYHANTAAALDLVQSVMPLVWEKRPQVQVWLVGKDPPPVVHELDTIPQVTVTGTVPDMRPYVGRAAVAVTPLRYSVGIQNKVLEAMAMGTPVVTTPCTCHALAVEPGTHLLVGDSAQELAESILTLLADDPRRKTLGQAGRGYVESQHNWDNIAGRLEMIYREAMETSPM